MPYGDIGLGMVLLTLLIKILLYPLSKAAYVSQIRQKKIQPLIKASQELHKNDQEAQGRAVMQIMKDNKANPFAGCLVMLAQIPIFIALYHVAQKGITSDLSGLYSFVSQTTTLSTQFLSFIDITLPFLPLAVLGGVLQFIQIKLSLGYQKESANQDKSYEMSSQEKQMELTQNIILYVIPIFLIVVIAKLPALVGIYFVANALFGIAQDYIIKKQLTTV